MKLSVSIPDELNELLEEEMEQDDRQRSWVIKKALEEYFERKQKSAPSRQKTEPAGQKKRGAELPNRPKFGVSWQK